MTEYHDITFVVTLTINEEGENPGESNVAEAIYVGAARWVNTSLDSQDAILVERQP